MKVIISPYAEKSLCKVSKINQIIIANKIRKLATYGEITNLESLRGYKNIFKVRVGDFRIVFRRTKDEIYIVLIGHRKEVYEKLKRLLG